MSYIMPLVMLPNKLCKIIVFTCWLAQLCYIFLNEYGQYFLYYSTFIVYFHIPLLALWPRIVKFSVAQYSFLQPNTDLIQLQ